MNDYRMIDPKTASDLRMSPEEAQAVIEMWAIHQRLANQGREMPSVEDLSEGLTIPRGEVRSYLSQVRALQKRGMRKPRPKSADVRMAAIASVVFIVAMAGALSAYISSNRMRARSYVPTWGRTVAVSGPGMAVPDSMPREVVGLNRSQLMSGSMFLAMARRSSDPPQFIFGIDRSLYFSSPRREIAADREDVLRALEQVVGGPLADRSAVPAQPVTPEEIAAAFASAPSNEMVPVAFEAAGAAVVSPLPDHGLLQWKSVQIAYGGKVSQASVPFARVSDPALLEEVKRAQARALSQLADAGLAIALPHGPKPAEAPTSLR